MNEGDPFIAGHLVSILLLFLLFRFSRFYLNFYFFYAMACIMRFVLSSLGLIMKAIYSFDFIFHASLFVDCILNFGFDKLLDFDSFFLKFLLDFCLLDLVLLQLILNLIFRLLLRSFLDSKINLYLEYSSFLFQNRLKKVSYFIFSLRNFKIYENFNFKEKIFLLCDQ